ncbi:hypothetical protein FRB97_005316 [Tulasnella sp. 331]|nr:hypothetical protein FRB97_005316 [Tulasnella sp. 331]
MVLRAVLATLPPNHPDIETIPSVIAILDELVRVVGLSADMAKGRVEIWNYSKNLIFSPPTVVVRDLDLLDATRLLLHEGRLLCQTAGDSSCSEVLVLVLDNFIIVTEPRGEEDGTTKFYVRARPIPIELVILEGLSQEGQLRSLTPATNPGRRRSYDRRSSQSEMLYPFTVRRLGEMGSALRFFTASTELRSVWGQKLQEAISTRHFARESQKAFEVRSLCEDTFSAPLFEDTPASDLAGDVPCLGKVTCSVAFSTSNGQHMVAVGTADGLWMGLHNETRVAGQTMPSEKPLKLKDDVQFFSVGRLNDRPTIVYLTQKGAESAIKALEPVGRKTNNRLSNERRMSSNTLSRTLSLFGDSRLEWFKTIREYVLWSNPFDVAFLDTKIAIISSKGFEILGLTDLKRVVLPNWKDHQLASLPRHEAARPRAVSRVNSNEYLLCFNHFGAYVDHQGALSRTHAIIEWEGTAERIAFQHPWIVVFSKHFVEVRSIDKGRLVQIIPGEDIRCVWDGTSTAVPRPSTPGSSGPINSTLHNSNARIHGVMSVADNGDGQGKEWRQRVFELLPAPQRMSGRDEESVAPSSGPLAVHQHAHQLNGSSGGKP